MTNVEYVLEWYDKKTEFVVDEQVVSITAVQLKELFDLEEILGDCYRVEPKHITQLQKLTKHEIDLTRYNYSVCLQQA